MEHKIKVLISVGSLGIGGNEIFVMNFYRHINKNNIQMDFITYDEKRLDFKNEIEKQGGKIYIVKVHQKNKFIKLLAQMKQVKTVLKKNHYNIIHCHSCSFVGLFRGALPGFLTKGTKVITHSHNPGMPKNTVIDEIERYILKAFLSFIVDMGFSCSDYAGESKYTKHFMNSERYQIIHNAIETENYIYDEAKRIDIRNRHNLNGCFVVGNVGRLAEQKNQIFLLEIFKEIYAVNHNSRLVIIGGGELENQLKEKAKEYGIAEKVIFTGSITNVADYYSAMDVFVMPSLYEGLPFTAIEAQVNGLKCVISDSVTKMTDATGDTQFVSLSRSAKEWAKVILKTGESRSTKEKTASVLKNYNICNEAIRLEDLYRNCAKGLS